jgi:hypothetical protein
MKNTDNIDNIEIEHLRAYAEAQIRAVKAFHERHREIQNKIK